MTKRFTVTADFYTYRVDRGEFGGKATRTAGWFILGGGAFGRAFAIVLEVGRS